MKIQEVLDVAVSLDGAIKALDAVDYSKTLSLFSRKMGLFDTIGWRELEFHPGCWESNSYRRSWTARPFAFLQESGCYRIEKIDSKVRITYDTDVKIPWYLFPALFPEFAMRSSMRQSLNAFVGIIKEEPTGSHS
ncbi:hypothetical protein [Mesoterricola sediminis]|uniref:hypothetical protein n=1 Tax=Mesoterricola sediminis TaxID=2927980 RepID=UPI00292CD676|nr:hypothetical protein [Mesoterricola sediminis]